MARPQYAHFGGQTTAPRTRGDARDAIRPRYSEAALARENESAMTGYALPAYEQPEERKTPPFEVLANAVLVTILAVVVSGAVYGFFLLLGEIF